MGLPLLMSRHRDNKGNALMMETIHHECGGVVQTIETIKMQ